MYKITVDSNNTNLVPNSCFECGNLDLATARFGKIIYEITPLLIMGVFLDILIKFEAENEPVNRVQLRSITTK